MNLKDQMNPNEVPFDPASLAQMPWDVLNEQATILGDEDKLWQQAQGAEGMKIAGLFDPVDVMTVQARKAYKDATGVDIHEEREAPKPSGPDWSKAKAGPQGTMVKSQDELRSQAEMLVRGGRVGTVQKAMEALKADWTSRGYIVK